MNNVGILGLVVAAFIAGSFVASPELRAFAAATIGSADIIDGSIQSVDIGSGQVKTADLGGSAVTSGKIADGTIQGVDIQNQAITKSKLGSDVLDTLTVTRRVGSQVIVENSATIGASVSCQSGEVVTGGGYVGSSAGLVVHQSTPHENTWEISVYNPNGLQGTITPVVLCAKLTL